MLQRFVKRLPMLLFAWCAALCSPIGNAAPEYVIREHLSKECKDNVKDPVVDLHPDTKIPHQYMLLLVFKKGTGSQYFGNPKTMQYGCILDVKGWHDSKGTLQTQPEGTQLAVATCPNDCVYPFAAHQSLTDGDDPLGSNAWGIVSAIDSAPPDGGPGRHIEVWQVPVFNACHARSLYAFHMEKRTSLLKRAYAAHHMLGEILVGYENGHQGPASAACP